MNKSDFTSRYRDPRWQRKRLEILQRDDFKCQAECGAAGKELHVHHFYYVSGRAPWEYPNDALITLCKDCHKDPTIIREMLPNWEAIAIWFISHSRADANGDYNTFNPPAFLHEVSASSGLSDLAVADVMMGSSGFGLFTPEFIAGMKARAFEVLAQRGAKA